MSTLKICKKVHKARDAGIHAGDLVLFELPTGDIKALKVENNTCVKYVYFSYHLNNLFQHGQPREGW
jgi:hypothetical protein